MNKLVHFVQLGCDKNRVDGEVMLGLLGEAGYSFTPDAESADAIIINTCGFIRDAVQESIDTVLEMSAYKTDGKTEGNCKALIVAGCMATRHKDEILNEIPEADAVVPLTESGDIVSVLDKLLCNEDTLNSSKQSLNYGSAKKYSTTGNSSWNAFRLSGRKNTAMPHIAYVKISEGCDNRCAYCTIPSIRGGYVERSFDLILDECRRLADDGAKEIVIVAQDTARYSRLPELLREISNIEGLEWIRLMYAYPEHITQELIDAMASSTKICPYIDMPIQHASDTVLKRMGRKSNRRGLLDVINRLREKIPGITLRTTLIVGFPGETEEEFGELLSFVREVGFDRLGVFAYSREDGTPAAKMKNQVKKADASARMDRLMRLQQEIHFAKQNALVGKTVNVMVDKETDGSTATGDVFADRAAADGRNTGNMSIGNTATGDAFADRAAADSENTGRMSVDRAVVGRMSSDAVEVDTVVTFDAKPGAPVIPGEIIRVRITGTDGYDLRGEIL